MDFMLRLAENPFKGRASFGRESFNPFSDKQLTLLGIVPQQACHFSSLSIFCLGCKTIRRRAARRLIVLHPKQNIESDLKLQTC
jgi:hypothetical protein